MGTCGHDGSVRHGVHTLIVSGAVLLGFAGLGARASAAIIKVNKRCYVNKGTSRATMTVVGRGFYPGDGVLITSSDGSVNTMATASSTGKIAIVTKAPKPAFRRPGKKRVTLTARDFTVDGSVITAQTRVTVAPLAVAAFPLNARFAQTVTWFFSGFTPGTPIFGHYLHHHRQVAEMQFGQAAGRCGVLKVQGSLFPGGNPRFKSYRVQIDDSKRYARYARPRVIRKLRGL
jgi:hypothetical protein